MDRLPLSDQHCSVARTLDIVGDRWTPLIVRDVALGISRFDAIQRNLGVSRKVLTQRLQNLLDHEVIARTAYQDNPPRFDYTLTEKGNDLAMVVLALQQFGDRWSFAQEGPPVLWRHLACGEISNPTVCCDKCGAAVRPGDAIPVKGPNFDEAAFPELGPAIDRIHALFD
jgi:DNA-binding HxlR family transcriptional regulator